MTILGKVVFVTLTAAGIYLFTEYWRQEEAEADAAAVTAGFINNRDRQAAKAAGVTDPVAWKSEADKRAKTIADAEAKRKAERDKADEIARELRRNPAEKMKVSSFTWRLGGFDTVAIATLTIQNDNDFRVKDVDLACRFSANSGTVLSTPSKTIYDLIPAKGRKSFKDVSIGFVNTQSARGSCWVESAKRDL